MNSEWKSFLEQQSASLDENLSARFPGGEALAPVSLFDLSRFGLLRVSGEDALEFLQGQFSNDLREVTTSHYQMNSYCNPKGRMLASFRVMSDDRGFLLQLPHETKATVLKRLPMFILRSKVVIEDLSERMVAIGIAGEETGKLLESIGLPVLADSGSCALHDGLLLCRLPGTPDRYQLIAENAPMQSIWKQLAEQARPADSTLWDLLEIRAGIPWVEMPTSELFVPQMLNLQLLDGVSFTKGCYTGQEVVARMRYLGKLKRRMYLAHIDTPQPPAPATALFSPQSDSPQGTGRVINACAVPEGGCDLLAVIEIEAAEAGEVRLGDEKGPVLKLLPLPYPFE